MNIGDRIKVKDQDIFGRVVRIHLPFTSEVVIHDEDLDAELCFKLSEVEEIKEWIAIMILQI